MVAPAPPRGRGGALAVGAGIFLSRIAGLVRDRVLAHTLGLSPAAGAFRAALRIPNLLQNLLGEGVLSASFIPVYARLYAEGRTEDASRVARAVGTLLALVASAMALGGVLAARPLVALLAPGFHDDARALTIRLVQILFPGVALLVMSAWCLGVLNSHRRFFLSYVSPVVWNAALIGAAIAAGHWCGAYLGLARRSSRKFSIQDRVSWSWRNTTMAQPRSKAAAAEDVLPSLENMIPFNDVQAELHRMVTELTWPAVQLSFFRRSRRDKMTSSLRQDVEVFAGCLPCGVMLGVPTTSDELVPALAIAADPGTEWYQLHHQPAKVSAEERIRWLRRLAGALAERVNRTPCRCAGEHRR